MRIKKIKLAGFKSFVDPTTIPISSNIVGIVGPNGCGKSNVIDAVRWVMGESSAKHLRGDSMADVIFSGSSARKPVGKASVEIVFDNSDGRAPGQYASYAEISIRREASRDGQSDYYLNKTKCRRKDITDIFLGTGLGPRAYSIIEQGMVTRIIEAKPEDLRAFFEEAAGISKFKERRRETENRMKHTRENLARVEDICKELETQLQKLQRQAKAAAKYKEYKQQERVLRAQLLSLRWQDLSGSLSERDAVLSTREIELEGLVAGQRAIEAEIEKTRNLQIEASDRFNEVQARYYSIGAEVTNVEQAIQHARETQQQRLREQEQLNRAWHEANQHLEADRGQSEHLAQALEASAPRVTECTEERSRAANALEDAEQRMHDGQSQWEQFTQQAAEPDKVREIQLARINQLEQHIAQLRNRETRLADEISRIEATLKDSDVSALRDQVQSRDSLCDSHTQRLERLEGDIGATQKRTAEITAVLEELRGRSQNAEAREASLRELQAAALGKYDQALNDWLKARNLDQAPRLAKLVNVEAGWEKAVERVLGADLAAVCIPELAALSRDLQTLSTSELTVFELGAGRPTAPATARPSLLDKVQGRADLGALLAGIFVAEDLDSAMAMRDGLSPHESIVTRDGLWLGKNWLSLSNEADARAGMLARERELESLGAELAALAGDTQARQAELLEVRGRQQTLEVERSELRRELNDYNRERAALHAQLGHKESQLAQLSARRQQIETEQGELAEQLAGDEQAMGAARNLLEEAERQAEAYQLQRQELVSQRDALRQALEEARAKAQAAADALHQVQIERQRMQTSLDSTRQSINRLESQLKDLFARRAEIENLLAHEEHPEQDLKAKLAELLQRRLEIEEQLTQARKSVSGLDAALREHEQARTSQEKKVQELREALEQARMARQELIVRRDTLDEQLREAGFDAHAVLQEIPAEATEPTCQQELDQLVARIERLGPINLVAIEEFEEQSQRKGYLDKQYADLSQALSTLEDAIRKIDRETRARFKETFEKVNAGFQVIFPRLFGGGQAYLELVGEDLLDTGVSVMARPPGKRNSTIHLLSGGEKALTAVSLLFAIFELNPAPFCLLDEVDAPLDDANVERYSQTLKAMSRHTQLIYITHNKISMEIADVLLGVTMSEPGVSRLVAVDVEEAMEMVAQ